jgi:hypothetical protein
VEICTSGSEGGGEETDGRKDIRRFASDPTGPLGQPGGDRGRQRTQQEVLGHRGRKGDPSLGIHHTLLQAQQRLGERDWERLETVLSDPRATSRGDCLRWMAKELLRCVYAPPTLTRQGSCSLGVLSLVLKRGVPGGLSAGLDHLRRGGRSAQLPPQPPHQRDDARPKPHDRIGPKSRPGIPQLG